MRHESRLANRWEISVAPALGRLLEGAQRARANGSAAGRGPWPCRRCTSTPLSFAPSSSPCLLSLSSCFFFYVDKMGALTHLRTPTIRTHQGQLVAGLVRSLPGRQPRQPRQRAPERRIFFFSFSFLGVRGRLNRLAVRIMRTPRGDMQPQARSKKTTMGSRAEGA